MPFDMQRTLRAMHWQTNARTHQAKPQIDQDTLRDARDLQRSADYTSAIELVQADPNWEHDPKAWRLIGLCCQGLARYEKNPDLQTKLYALSETASAIDRGRRMTEAAEADVNLAATLVDQNRYDEALHVAVRARNADPNLPTAHVAILTIYNRQRRDDDVIKYLAALANDNAWVFEDAIFRDHLIKDPDLAGISDHLPSVNRS
jgi:tetratricopeptide (TPR) repeat protein